MLHRLRFFRPKASNICIHRTHYYPSLHLHRFIGGSSIRLNTTAPTETSTPPPKTTTENEHEHETAEDILATALGTLTALPAHRLKDINAIKKILKHAAARTSSPHIIYEGFLNFFIRTSRTTPALFVMQRMEARGYTLLNQTVAKLLVLVAASAEYPPEECARLIVEIVKEPEYAEEQLRDLLQTIASYAIDREKKAQTLFVEAFRDARGGSAYAPSLKMLPTFVSAAVRADKLSDAFSLLSSYSTPTPTPTNTNRTHVDRAARTHIFAAWLAFLKALRETRPADVATYARVLDQMSAHQVQVQVNGKLFEQVIAHEARLEDWAAAFKVYAALRALSKLEMAGGGVDADEGGGKRRGEKMMRIGASTFATLFRMYTDMKRSRTLRLGGDPDLASQQGILPPRALFKDFTAVFPPSASSSPSSSSSGSTTTTATTTTPPTQTPNTRIYTSTPLLHVILRAFMAQADYAGALVALRTFVANGAQMTHLTYYVVVKALVGRVWYEAGSGRPMEDGMPSKAKEGGAGERELGTMAAGKTTRKTKRKEETKQKQKQQDKTTWTTRFLGIQSKTKPLLGMKLVNHILYVISRREWAVGAGGRMYPDRRAGERFRDQGEDEEEPSSSGANDKDKDTEKETGGGGGGERGGRLCKVPTMHMMEHVQRPKPFDFTYELVPLERLLLRAVWAVDGVGGGGGEGDGDGDGEERVRAEVRRAEREMWPEYWWSRSD